MRRRRFGVLRPAVTVGLLTLVAVLVLSPAWLERAGWAAQGRIWIHEQQVFDATDGADVAALVRVAERHGPGRIYGGLRITDAPREAQVFADGYYIGIVNDFDGVFQHANLEGGSHRIEIQAPGFESVAFDVMVQPVRTLTLRAEM